MSKILLVEDDYALAMGTTYTLKAEGYEVVHAKKLSEARCALTGVEGDNEANGIDLVLLDVMLPDGDGFSFLEELMEKEVDVPVIFSTAVGDEANIVRGLDLGADDYITKPYKVKEMLSRIAAVLRRQERARRMALKTVNKEENQDSSCSLRSICSKCRFRSRLIYWESGRSACSALNFVFSKTSSSMVMLIFFFKGRFSLTCRTSARWTIFSGWWHYSIKEDRVLQYRAK